MSTFIVPPKFFDTETTKALEELRDVDAEKAIEAATYLILALVSHRKELREFAKTVAPPSVYSTIF